MATSLSCCVLFLGSVTQAFVCPRPRHAPAQSCPPPQPVGLRPTVDSRKVVPTLQAIDGTDPSGGRWGGRWERSLGRRGRGPIVWREATKNFASKAVQRQQGEELLRVSGKLDILLPLSALYLLRSTSYPRRVTLAALYVWGLRSIVSFSATCKNNHYIIVIHLTN